MAYRTQANILTTPRGPGGTGAPDDAKVYELGDTIAANTTVVYDIDADAFYIDNGPTVSGTMQFNVDECTPMMVFRYGLFFRTRRFMRIRIQNLSGAPVTFHLVYSRNPNFLVMQF